MALSLRKRIDAEIAADEAKKFDTVALNGRMIQIVGEYGYDSNGNTYQWQAGSFLPPKLSGWVPVTSKYPKPFAHSVKGAKKKGR